MSQEFYGLLINQYFNLTIGFFVIANALYAIILVLGYLNARTKYLEYSTGISTHLTPLKAVKPISILVPCYNEEQTVKDSVLSMLHLDYPSYEIIVCNDGSTDQSIEVLKTEFELHKVDSIPPQVLPCQKIRAVYRSSSHLNLFVIDKDNGGKADALNAAINFSQYPLICCVDSDSIIDSEGLMNVAMPFLESDEVIATGGTILLANTDQVTDSLSAVNTSVTSTWMGMIQSIEYLRAFLVGRLGWDYIHCDSVISGAFGLFRKSLVIKIGGYAKGTIGEDMELLLRMQSYCLRQKEKYAVKLLPIPVCWTEPPTDIKTLKNQRIRWTQGLAESLWLHRNLFFRRWSGRLGWLGLPYFLFFELLAAPLEIIGYLIAGLGIYLEVLTGPMIATLFAVTILYGCILNLGAIVIDQATFEKYSKISDILKLTAGAIMEHLGYRQLHLYWRLVGMYRWIIGKQEWGTMKRVGIRKSEDKKAA